MFNNGYTKCSSFVNYKSNENFESHVILFYWAAMEIFFIFIFLQLFDFYLYSLALKFVTWDANKCAKNNYEKKRISC
jgi:hypothetical protein